MSDTTWWPAKKIEIITSDSLILSRSGQRWSYSKYNKEVDKNPEFDEIVLTTTPCFGACPVFSMIIKSNGDVVFVGERFVTDIGIYTAHITQEEFLVIENEFRKANVEDLMPLYDKHNSDVPGVVLTVSNDKKIVNSIMDFGSVGPPELELAIKSMKFLFLKTNLEPVKSSTLPYYKQLYGFNFASADSTWYLNKSESFFLWNYLREAPLVDTKFKKTFDLEFWRTGFWFVDTEMYEKFAVLNKDPETTIKAIKTDGRYYKFIMTDRDPITFDIGFNFFERNKALLEFRVKEISK